MSTGRQPRAKQPTADTSEDEDIQMGVDGDSEDEEGPSGAKGWLPTTSKHGLRVLTPHIVVRESEDIRGLVAWRYVLRLLENHHSNSCMAFTRFTPEEEAQRG